MLGSYFGLARGDDQPPTKIQVLLQEFKHIFSDLVSLPPVREYDHTIVLKEGTEPVQVRPYPDLLKNKIE